MCCVHAWVGEEGCEHVLCVCAWVDEGGVNLCRVCGWVRE